MPEQSLRPLWIGIACMLAGCALLYWSASSNRPEKTLDGDCCGPVDTINSGTIHPLPDDASADGETAGEEFEQIIGGGPIPRQEDSDDIAVCAQVITPARNIETGEARDFPTPCDVPEGWEVAQPEVVE